MAELTHDEDGFHEIQLSGKQLGFVVMLSISALVLVFVLGVQVGRGVRAERGEDPVDAASAAASTTPSPAETTAPAEPPAPISETELSYPKRLDENPPKETLKPRAEEPPPPVQEAPPPAPPSSSTTPATNGRPAAAAASAATPAASPVAPNVPTAGRAGRWVVQVITLSNRAGAAEITQRLIAKGYPAFLLMPAPGSPALYRVQIGRFNDRNEADRTVRRLAREDPPFKAEVKR